MSDKETYYHWNRTDKDYMFIDSRENAIDSLETALYFLNREDNLKWKWIVLSLYHALYMFCVANLEGSNYKNVLETGIEADEETYFKRGDEKWKKSNKQKISDKGAYKIVWHEIEGEPQVRTLNTKKNKREKLIGFWTALARVQDGELWMGRYIFSKPLKLNNNQLKSIELLVEYRNRFSHFIPIGLMTDIKHFINIIPDILDILNFLALESKNLAILYDEGAEGRIKKTLEQIRKHFKEINKN